MLFRMSRRVLGMLVLLYPAKWPVRISTRSKRAREAPRSLWVRGGKASAWPCPALPRPKLEPPAGVGATRTATWAMRAAVLERERGVEIAAPSPFSVVAFRWVSPDLSPQDADAANARILARINADGRAFISHALVGGRYTLRVAIGNIRTERRHLQTFLQVFRDAVAAESPRKP